MREENALIIFAKAPVPGLVKTRFQPRLSPGESAMIHSEFVMETIRIARNVGGVRVFIACHPDTNHPFFVGVAKYFGIELFAQEGCDLGERMSNVFKEFPGKGFGKAVIIGSDSPDLPPAYIKESFERLDNSDMVIGPTKDGGYYLIGGKGELPVFDAVPWGTEKVFAETVSRAERSGIKLSVLPEWHDVDTWEDIKGLKGLQLRGLNAILVRIKSEEFS